MGFLALWISIKDLDVGGLLHPMQVCKQLPGSGPLGALHEAGEEVNNGGRQRSGTQVMDGRGPWGFLVPACTEKFCWSKRNVVGVCFWKAAEQLEVNGIIISCGLEGHSSDQGHSVTEI